MAQAGKSAFFHDERFSERADVLPVLIEFGALGYGMLMMVMEALWQCPEGIFKYIDIPSFVYRKRLDLEQTQALIKICLNSGLLIECEGGFLCPVLRDDADALFRKQASARNSGIISAQKRAGTYFPTDAEQTLNERSTNVQRTFNGRSTNVYRNMDVGIEESRKEGGCGGKPEPPPGKIKHHDWIFLSEYEYECLLLEFKRNGLDENDLKKAIQHMDSDWEDHPEKRNWNAFKKLKLWPLEHVSKVKRQTKADEERLANLQNRDPSSFIAIAWGKALEASAHSRNREKTDKILADLPEKHRAAIYAFGLLEIGKADKREHPAIKARFVTHFKDFIEKPMPRANGGPHIDKVRRFVPVALGGKA